MAHKPQYTKAFTALLTFALVAAGCTKKRDATLPDSEALEIFAISDFATPSSEGFKAIAKSSAREKSLVEATSNKASNEKGLVAVDTSDSSIPQRLRFMFENLEVSGQEAQDFKIVFGVDSKYVTAYKLTNNVEGLTRLEKQLAVSPSEVQLSIDLQKATSSQAKKEIMNKMATAQKARSASLLNRANINVLVPLFKYDIAQKGVLERTKNELRESTSTLKLRETEFSQATHIRLNITSDSRKDVGSVDQKVEMDQIFTMESLDNKIHRAADLQSRYNFNMKFVADDSQVLTKLDSDDMKVYELTTVGSLSDDEKRLINTGRAAGEIIRCSDSGVTSADKNCVLRLVAKVPVTYKNARLVLADSKENTSNTIELQKVTKAQAQGLVEIAREVRAERARPTGIIDPLNTIKVADLKGEFYFRRTFEDASNMMLIGKSGTSGDLSVVKFELEKDRLVVRNQKALIKYEGQTAKDKEELMSVPVKYFKLETVDADGVALHVPKLIDAKKEDAEYVEIDWTKNTIPVANSPLAFFDAGECWAAETSQQVTDMDMRLNNDGILNFSLSGSYTVKPGCHNAPTTNNYALGWNVQFNYNVIERLSFKKRTNAQVDDAQWAPNIAPNVQSSLNFATFTMGETITSTDVRPGRENSEVYRPVVHDFRNGKVLHYWVGGLKNAPSDRKALITQAAVEVVAEWNEAFRKAFKGTNLERSGDYIVLHTGDDDTGHLGDLDRNYLWFFDQPTENGLLGVAQPAPNPYSGTIIANNVMVYSGNSEMEIRRMMESYKESREYEKMLDEAKQEALAEFQKELAAQQQQQGSSAAAEGSAGAASGSAAAEKVRSLTKSYGSFVQKLVLSSRPVAAQRFSSKYASNVAVKKAGKSLQAKVLKGRNVVSDAKVTSNKDFTRSVLQAALSQELKNDPIMMEAIIARELARTENGMSQQMKQLLLKQAQMKEMSARFDQQAKKRGGCFLYTRTEYNDKFLNSDFNTLFKKEIKATLLHEVGHAIGLVHNFKGSFDKANFNFAGEETNRNYTSIMDYIAAPEMEYQGPGTYDVHALRAAYTGLVELSDDIKAMVAKTGGVLTNQSKVSVNTVGGQFIAFQDVKKILGFRYFSDMAKQTVAQTGLLKHYGQCNDMEVGLEPGCARYDQGASAVEVVKNEIQNYHRSYATSYHASDRLNFGWPQKVNVIRNSISRFSTIRAYLDDYFRMVIYRTALSDAEMADFREASHLGYDFFHEVIRIPDTNLAFGTSKEEIKQRLIPVPYMLNEPVIQNGQQAVDANGQPVFKQTPDVRILEARRVYDAAPAPMSDRLDTLGIGYDKQFALQFLLTANPAAMTDDSQTGWIGYNEFEQYFMGVQHAAQSQNMLTLLEIISGTLNAGFVDKYHNLQTVELPVNVNRNLLDSATLGGLADTNQYRYPGLDTFAEFFKVGTLKGGKTVKDRLMATRYGQSSKSAAGVKFFAADNAIGAQVLVSKAARKGALLENKDTLAQGMIQMIQADMELSAKVAAVKKADEKLKDKAFADIVASSEELKAVAAKGDAAAAELVKTLTALNQNGAIVSAEEIKANPNFALDKQVLMLRSMTSRSMSYFTQVKPMLEQVPLEQLNNVLQQLAGLKSNNTTLANSLDLLALGQEVLVQAVSSVQIVLKDRGPVSGDVVMGLMMDASPLSSSQQNLMYAIEDLARYTSILNPEYIY